MTINEFEDKFFALVDRAEHIVISSHISPDDDSIGSVLSVYDILTEKYRQKNIRIIYTGERVERYNVFENFDVIEWVDDLAYHLDGVDTLIVLDASQYARFSKFPEKLECVPNRVAIDHHTSQPDEFTVLLHKKEFSSNCELLYRALMKEQPLTKKMAEYFLLGIIGDTGNFAYIKPDQSGVFLLAKELVEKVGVSIDEFRSRYMGIPIRIIPLLQVLVAHTSYRTLPNWPPVHYTYVERTVLLDGGYTDEDMSAASHIYIGQYMPKIVGYGWGFVVTPRTDQTCRMSGRSLPMSVNVRDLHERMGIGGGHDRASGGFFAESDPTVCIAKVFEFMKENKPLLG